MFSLDSITSVSCSRSFSHSLSHALYAHESCTDRAVRSRLDRVQTSVTSSNSLTPVTCLVACGCVLSQRSQLCDVSQLVPYWLLFGDSPTNYDGLFPHLAFPLPNTMGIRRPSQRVWRSRCGDRERCLPALIVSMWWILRWTPCQTPTARLSRLPILGL